MWGVATSAYQSEGGYNQTGMPHTNWAGAERRGDVEPVGHAGLVIAAFGLIGRRRDPPQKVSVLA